MPAQKVLIIAITLTGFLFSACSNANQDKVNTADISAGTNADTDVLLEVRQVATGFISTEGPVWDPSSGQLLFSDIPGDTIYAFDAKAEASTVLRSPSNTANGLALDGEGYLLAAEQKTRLISRMNISTGQVEPYIKAYTQNGEDRKFNSPNDMAVHPNGSVYFTDPPFGLRGREDERELDFNGVFMRKPNGSVSLFKKLEIGTNPNGIKLSPDSKTLYLGISDDTSGPILAFDVAQNGELSNERVFASGQNNDGMAIDVEGTLYVATRTGIQRWSAQGENLGMIRLPDNQRTTNCAFGGADMSTLYITSRSPSLYAVQLPKKGYE